jgi:hypothetical protein
MRIESGSSGWIGGGIERSFRYRSAADDGSPRGRRCSSIGIGGGVEVVGGEAGDFCVRLEEGAVAAEAGR